MIGISPVETDDIEVVVFDRDSPRKQTFAAFLHGLDIDHDAARFAKKLASHKREVIVIFLEVGIEHRHLCEALRQELVRQSIGDGIHNVMHEPLALPLELCIADTTIQVKPPQEILITGRLDVVIAVLMKILNLSFREWVDTIAAWSRRTPVRPLPLGRRFGRRTESTKVSGYRPQQLLSRIQAARKR